MDDKDFLASLDQGGGRKTTDGGTPDRQDRDEIQRLLDGQQPDTAPEPEVGAAEPPPADALETPEPTSVLEMLRQASEAITPEDDGPRTAPAAADPAASDPMAFDGDETQGEAPPPEPAAPLYETDPEGYSKAQSWLDGEGTASAPGATHGRLSQMRSTLRGRPGEEPDAAEEAAPDAAVEPERADDPLEKLRLARERLRQSETAKAPEPKRIPAQPRDAVLQAKAGWQPSSSDRKAARKAKRGAGRKKAVAKAAARRGGGRRADERSPDGWQGRVAMLICLLLGAAAVQIVIMGRLGVAFALKDLAAGLCATFPVLFIMLAVRPAGFKQWFAVLLTYAAIVVVGSVVYALSLWLGRVGPLAESALLTRLTLVLGLYVLTWGPLFLFTVWLLTRMDLWPEDRVGALAGSRG